MAHQDLLRGRVRPQKTDDDFEEFSSSDEDVSHEEDHALHARGRGIADKEQDEPSSASSEDEVDDEDEDLSESDLNTPGSLSHISFGALASAQQASLSSNKKRKRSAIEAHDRTASRSPSPFHEAEERRAGAKASSSAGRDSARASKHAPTEQSSKKAVSRKRTVISVSTPAARDPRFSSLSGHLGDSQALERRYGFLDEYRKTELAALKKSLRETRDERAKDRLQREIKVMEDRQKTKNRAEAENEVRREHRRLEKDRVKEGKQPYFLKQSEVKKRLLEKQFEELGEKKAARAMERRRRKQTAKERRDLPRTRRDYSFAGPD